MSATPHRRQPNSSSASAAIGGLLVGAVLLFVAGEVKDASVDTALRHTTAAAATVLRVNGDRIASVRYFLRGQLRTGTVNVSDAHGIDGGDKVALRVPDLGGGSLQIQPVFHPIWYSAPATALAVAAVATAGWLWLPPRRRHRGQRFHLLPEELSRLHRHTPPGPRDPTTS